MTTEDKARCAIERQGGTLDATSDTWTWNADAPDGQVWRSTLTHTMCYPHTNSVGQTWKAEALRDLRRDVALGLDEDHLGFTESELRDITHR